MALNGGRQSQAKESLPLEEEEQQNVVSDSLLAKRGKRHVSGSCQVMFPKFTNSLSSPRESN